MRRAALFLLPWFLGAVLTAPLSAQASDTLPPGEYSGSMTGCANLEIVQQFRLTWPRPYDGRWWIEYDALQAHERQHVIQMSRYGSCAQIQALILANPDSVRLDFESEAGCAQLRVYEKEANEDFRSLFGALVAKLRERVSDTVSTPAIVHAVQRYCREPNE